MYECSDKTLTLSCPPCTFTLSFTQNASLGHAGVIWGGSFLLIQYLQHNQPFIKTLFTNLPLSRVLELGAGTGLVSFAFGLLFKPHTAVISDLPHCTQIIEEQK
jgi:hypothetical protein